MRTVKVKMTGYKKTLKRVKKLRKEMKQLSKTVEELAELKETIVSDIAERMEEIAKTIH